MNVVKEFTQVEAAALIKEVNSVSVSFISDSLCVFLSFVRTPKLNKLQTQQLPGRSQQKGMTTRYKVTARLA